MKEARLHTIVQVKAFLDGTTEGAFRVPKTERHQFIERVLIGFGYTQHGRADHGGLLRYLERITGLSRQPMTRLVRQYRTDGRLSHRHRPPQHGFPRRFTATDAGPGPSARGGTGPRRGQQGCPSTSVAPRNQMGGRVIFGSTACIRATKTG